MTEAVPAASSGAGVPGSGGAPGAGAAHGEVLLSVTGLRKSFGGVQAVADVNFELRRGELLAMIGPNGAGKSTCFNMINGQLVPDAGRIMFAGTNLAGMKPRAIWRMGVGRTFQVAATYASMTVAENVQMALLSRERQLLRIWPHAARMHRREALELLAQVGLAARADEACATLAYGDIKTVELAVALANRPNLLLMDEPTAGMAPRERSDLMTLTRKLVRELGIAVLFTEHSMDVVFAHADRIMVLARGELIANGTPDEIRGDPQVAAVYFGSGKLAGGAGA